MSACTDAGGAVAEDATKNTPAAPISVESSSARVVERPRVLELTGTLEPNRQANLSPEISGHVSKVLVERGSVVAEGDPLIVLAPGDFRLMAKAATARAKAQLSGLGLQSVPSDDADLDDLPTVSAASADRDAAVDRMERTRGLLAAKAVDEETWVRVQSEAKAAEARYQSARQQVRSSVASYQALRADASVRRRDAESATLRAPFAGAVMDRTVEVGEYVGPLNTVVQLVDASQLRLELDVPERYSEDVAQGQTLSVTVDGTDKTVTGTVRFVAAALDTDRRTLSIEAVIDNSNGKLRAGHFGRARISIGGTQRVVEVPSSALVQRAGVYRLYVVDDGHAKAHIVEVVEKDESIARIEGDLEDGDAVITSPGRDVADGVPVTVTKNTRVTEDAAED